jgi:hypothetical protein
VAYVSDVLDIGNIIAEIFQVSDEYIEADIAFCVSEMSVAIDGRAADVDSDVAFFQRFELLLFSGQAVI